MMLSRMLSNDSPIIRFLIRGTDLVLLNMLFILSSLPILTIGASITSLVTSWQRILKNNDQRITAGYFQIFRENLKKSTLLFILLILTGTFFLLDYMLLSQQAILTKLIGITILIPFCVVWLLVFIFGFAYIGRYENSLQMVIKNSLLIALNNLSKAVILVVMNILIVYFSISTPERLLTAIYINTFFGFSLLACINGILIQKAFKKIEKSNQTSY